MNITLQNFIDLKEYEKSIILDWRNHSSVKQWMYTSNDILLVDHLNFIKKLENDKTKKYFLAREKDEMIGIIYLTDINMIKKYAEFGIYANPNLHGQGKKLMYSILNYAFNTLKLSYLYAEVFEDNKKAIELYKKFGFQKIDSREKRENKIFIMEKKNDFR